MKKGLIFALLLIGVNASSQLSNETRQLFYDNKISTMTLGLMFCDKAVENVDCAFNYPQEQIIINTPNTQQVGEAIFPYQK